MSHVQFYVDLFDFDSDSNLIYKGSNPMVDAAHSDTSWYIWKFSWDTDGNIGRIEGPRKGSWIGRASLGWNA